ncbi:MAG: STAS domain-containing protein [Clostridiales bacterium]|nr:STAS domain-containing protein [Clostridiales bacterium]
MNLTSFLQEKQLTIALRGEIDHHTARDILRVVSNKIDLYLPLACVLDFREVTFMDSSGIAIVISALRKMRELSGRLVLRDVPPQPMKVLRASGMEQIVEIEERSVSV